MTTKLTRTGFVALAMAALPGAAPLATHAGMDALYARLAEGIRTAAPDLSRSTYSDDTQYLAPMPSPIDRGTAVHQRMRESGERLRTDGVTMTISYKVASRQLVGDSLAIDTGYYKTEMTRPTGEPRSMTRYNKFLLVAAKQPDGTWKITHDASLPATEAAWEEPPHHAHNGL